MQNEITDVTPPSGSTVWARTFAAVYNPFLWLGERVGLRAHRAELLAQAHGCVLEIGAGTGLNLPHYPDDLNELILAEPDAAMRARLEKRLRRSDRVGRVIDAPAERLPLPDGSIDTVISTLVLCTVDAPDRALQEIARVLRPDGQLLLLEHEWRAMPPIARPLIAGRAYTGTLDELCGDRAGVRIAGDHTETGGGRARLTATGHAELPQD